MLLSLCLSRWTKKCWVRVRISGYSDLRLRGLLEPVLCVKKGGTDVRNQTQRGQSRLISPDAAIPGNITLPLFGQKQRPLVSARTRKQKKCPVFPNAARMSSKNVILLPIAQISIYTINTQGLQQLALA